MAEAFLQVLLDNLSSLIEKEIGLIVGADKEMKKLSSTLTAIQAVLEDAEERQFESESIRNWLRKLNGLAFEIGDLLDECGIEVSKLEKKNHKFRSLKKILLKHKIGRRIKEMVDKLDDVAAERQKFHLRESSIERQTVVAIRETGSVLNEPNDVFGRDEEKEKIVDILVNQVKDCQQLSILPILGLGGLGKTTLAQLVYNDQRVKEHFDLKMWVCVSDDFDSKVLIKSMIESATLSETASNLTNLDALECRLFELLNKKRYLLVLDDVWNEDQEKWAKLKMVLACGSTGASIVLTTRSKKVADIMRTVPAHYLSELSDEHCWLLFKQRAFGEQVEQFPSLEAIGREIVKKSSGVPLAAKALGGLLRFKNDEQEWLYVKENELWKLEQEETSILPSLRLSYRHLPLILRRCFAYCALFPKDAEIDKEELIYLWMAHGCISSNGNKEVEDIGRGVWSELVLRSLLQLEVSKFRWKTVLKMHDLVHDLALSVMENQLLGPYASNVSRALNNRIRQVHVKEGLMILPTSIQLQVSTLTSLVNFSHLKMLTANWGKIESLPSSIGRLKQLRSLNLSGTSIQTLPNTICKLQNLQILNLSWCRNLVKLPKNMGYVDSLRHLILEGCTSLTEMPSGIGDLTSLKTLSQFIVGDKIGNQLGELEHLNLGGKLEIKHLERVKNQMDARRANLSKKPNLRDLVLEWEGGYASESREMMDKLVLEALEPHPNIQTLKIFGFKGSMFPIWTGNSTMDNVVEIKIDNCPNCLNLPPLGHLPRLKRLVLSKFGMIEFITEGEVRGGDPVSIVFPSLEELHLQSLPNLKGLLNEETRENFPNLQELFIHECSSLRLPPLPSLKMLRVTNCGHLRLSPLPSLKRLQVSKCGHSTLSSLSKLTNLTSLVLELDENTTCIPNNAMESLSNLKDMVIRNAHEHILPAERIRCLKSLKYLEMNMTDAATCLRGGWFQHFTTLEVVTIFGSNLVEVPCEIKYLHSLKTLWLLNFRKMICLPEGLQYVHSLKILSLHRLCELNSLPDWLDKLIYLEQLDIVTCPRIASLPSTIQQMTNLQILAILNCPTLTRRCEKGKGEDWHKIAHIPNLYIR